MRNNGLTIFRAGCFWFATTLTAGFPENILAEFQSQPDPIFREVAQAVGLNFQHFIGATGEFFFPENMGSGVAFFDYDGDGDLDVYLLQGTLLDKSKEFGDSLFQSPPQLPPRNQLFCNKLIETGQLGFENVTGRSGVGHQGYGMGVAVGDYDNDGHLDLYVTNFGPNVLYKNNGDGTFSDVTREAKADDPRWSMSAAFLDHDRDGDADLFLTNYVNFTVKGNRECKNPLGIRDYCAPAVFEPVPDRFFQNEGNGQFRDATEETGIGAVLGNGLGVMVADFDANGWLDLWVANDGSANHLWRNRDGTFMEEGLLSGTAYNIDGAAEAGMGITAADFDGDGDEDIFVTNNRRETNTLYLNVDGSNFYDATAQFGLSSPSFPNTGFGTLWFDYDNNGALDLFVANGAVGMLESRQGDGYPYAQPNQLYRNNGKGRFQDISASAGESLELLDVGRGAAFGDLDNDGDVDIVVANNNGPARLLLNQVGSRQHWLGIRLQGKRGGVHTRTEGARVAVMRDGHPPVWRRVHRDGSYLSANDSRIYFGLGQDPELKGVIVHWPAGGCETWEEIPADRIAVLREGSGTPCQAE